MKISSIIKLVLLFVVFYYIITFIQVNQQNNEIKFPWLGSPAVLTGPAWSIVGACLALGFLGSAVWMLVKTITGYFSPTGKLSRNIKKVEEKYYYGIEALSKGDNEAAGLFFEEILNIDPNNFRTLVKYGELLRERGNARRAISLHQQALTLSQNNVKVLHELSLDYMAAGDISRAKEMLERIIEISPKGNIEIYRQLRDLHVDQGDWTSAMQVQRGILGMVSTATGKKDESDMLSGIEFEHAMDLSRNEKPEEAIELLNKLLDRDPNFLPAHLELGEVLLREGKVQDAIKTWRQGYEVTNSPVLLTRLENYFLDAEKPDKAIETYARVISENQDLLLPRLLLGKLYYRLEMLDRAIDIFEEIDSEFEYAPVMFYFMGKIQARKGNYKEATEILRNVIRSSGILETEYVCSVTGDTFSEYVPFSPAAGKWNTVQLNVRRGKSLSELEISSRPIYS